MPRWAPDGKSIAFVSDRAEPGKKWAIYLLNLSGGIAEGEAHAITDVQNEQAISAFEFSPDGKTVAYIAPDEKSADAKFKDENGEDWKVWNQDWPPARLHFVQLQTRNVRRFTAVSDSLERHVAGFSWSPDGKHIAFVSVSNPRIEEPYLTGSQISIMGVDIQSAEYVCSFPMPINEITWAGDGFLYFRADTPAGLTCAGRCIYKIHADIRLSPGIKSSRWTKFAFGEENDADHLSRAGHDVFARVSHNMEDRIYLLPNRCIFSKPQKIETCAAVRTADSDDIVIAVVTSNVNSPVDVYTTTASGGALVQLSDHGAAFRNHHFGTCNLLSCPSTDGEVQLDHAYFTPGTLSPLPKKPFPTIVLIHGGPPNRLTDSFSVYYYHWGSYLLSLGYGILLPNYRGSSSKGAPFSTYTNRGIGKWDYEDIITATENAIDSGYADKNRLIVGGVSQGGFLSFLSSTRNGMHSLGWEFKASIPVAGISDSDAMALTSDLGATCKFEQDGRSPWNVAKTDTRTRNSSALWEFDEAVKHSKATGRMVIPPMLILHGEVDERVPLTQAWGMRRALTSVGLPFEMVTYPRQPHIFTERKHWGDMMERIERWCETCIGPGELSTSTWKK